MNCARAAAFAIGVLATGGCALWATGCGRSPTAPDGIGTPLRGRVTDRAYRPVAGALVGVLDGPLAGTTKLTDDEGRFELTGTAAGAVTLRVSRNGFQTRTLAFSQPSTTAPVYWPLWLDTLEPPIGLDPGDYRLTLAIDLANASGFGAPCAGFPAELASRSYRATIAERSPPMSHYNRSVRADDATLDWPDLFDFGVAGSFVGFEWDDSLTETLPGFRYLDIGGNAPTTEPALADGSSVSVPFNGGFAYGQLKSARGVYNHCSQVPAEQIVAYHTCSSARATMVFTKR